MLNKNKKRMVKLFLLVFIILISCYNVYAEESQRIPGSRYGSDVSDRKPYTEPASSDLACCSIIGTSSVSFLSFSLCKDGYDFYIGDGAGGSVKATKEKVADGMSCTPYSQKSLDVTYRGTVSTNAYCKDESEPGRERCVKDSTTSESTGTKQCTVWDDYKDWERCDECDSDNDCTMYECKSLGMNCMFDSGTKTCAKKDCLGLIVCGGVGDLDMDGTCDADDNDMDNDGHFDDALGNRVSDKDYNDCNKDIWEAPVFDDKTGPQIRSKIEEVRNYAVKFDLIIEAYDVSGVKSCSYKISNDEGDLNKGSINSGWITFSKNDINVIENDKNVLITCLDNKDNSNSKIFSITRKSDLEVNFPEFFNTDKETNIIDNNVDELIITSPKDLTRCIYSLNDGSFIGFDAISDDNSYKSKYGFSTVHTIKTYLFFKNKLDTNYDVKIKCYRDEDVAEKDYAVEVRFNDFVIIDDFNDYAIGEEPSTIRGIKGSFKGGIGRPECGYIELSATSLSDAKKETNALNFDDLKTTMSITGDKNKWIVDSGQLSQVFKGKKEGDYYGVICQDSGNFWTKLKKAVEIKDYFPPIEISINVPRSINIVEEPFLTTATLTLIGRNKEAECRFKQTGSSVDKVNWGDMESLGTKVWYNTKLERLPKQGILIEGSVNLHFMCKGLEDNENYGYKIIPISVSYSDTYEGIVIQEFACINDCDKQEQTWGLYTSGPEASSSDKCYYICEGMNGYNDDTYADIGKTNFKEFDVNGEDNRGFYHKHKFIEQEEFLSNTNYKCWIYCKDSKNKEYLAGQHSLDMRTPGLNIKDNIITNPIFNPSNGKNYLYEDKLAINIKTSGGINNDYKCRITNNLDKFSFSDQDDLFDDNIILETEWNYELTNNGLKYDRLLNENLVNHGITITGLEQNIDGSEKCYHFAIQCKDDAGQYTKNSKGDIRAKLLDFCVDFVDLGIVLQKPGDGGSVEGKNINIEIITTAGSTGMGDAKSCEINNQNLNKLRVNQNSFKFTREIILGISNTEYETFEIKCIDNNDIIYTKNAGFNVILEPFEILNELYNVNKNKASLSFAGKKGENGYGRGYCTYDLRQAGKEGIIARGEFDINSEGGYGGLDTTTYEKELFLNKGIYFIDVSCKNRRGGTEIAKEENAFVIEIEQEGEQAGIGYIGPNDIGKRCGEIVIAESDIGKYCCSDGTIKNNEAECGKVEPCEGCAELNSGKTACVLNNAKCNLICAPYCVTPNIGGVYKCTPTETQTCKFKSGSTTDGVCANDNCPTGFIAGQCVENPLCRSDYDDDLVEDALDCNDYDETIGQCKWCAVCYQGNNIINADTSSDSGECLADNSKCSVTICVDGCVGKDYLSYEQANIPNICSIINNKGTCSQNKCVEKSRIKNDNRCITPEAACTDSIYDASQTVCVNAGCRWSGETYKCNTDCHTGWTYNDNNKICEAPSGKEFTVTITKPVNNAKIDKLPVEFLVKAGKKSDCKYIRKDRNKFGEIIDKEGEVLQNFDDISLDGKQFMNSFSSLNNEKYTYHVYCSAIDGSDDYGNAYVDFSVNVAGGKFLLNDCNIVCTTIGGCTCPTNCVKTEVDKDENCGGVLGVCINKKIDSQPTGCTGNNYCDGNENCVSMYWNYTTNGGSACRPSNNVFIKCKPSNVGGDYRNNGNDIERDGVNPGDSLRAYDDSAPMGSIWCDSYECAIGNPTITKCQGGSEPTGNGVLKGVSSYPDGYRTTTWTYVPDGRIYVSGGKIRVLGACEWSCNPGYAQSGNGCVSVQPCVINSISWRNKEGPIAMANDGEIIYILIEGSNCNIGDSLTYGIYEKDILVTDWAQPDDIIKQDTIKLQNKEGAIIEWRAVFDANDGFSPNNNYYIKIGDRESTLLVVKEVFPDYRRTKLEECSDNCIDPDGCTCPDGCEIVGDINKGGSCGTATKDITAPQILQIVTKSTNNYITINERAKCYVSTTKDPFAWTELNRDGEGKKHWVTLTGSYYIKCIDVSNNEGSVIGVSPMT